MTDLWWSIGLGGGIGLLYSAASHLSHRRAMRYSGSRFMKRFVGGMMLRMALVLVLIVLVLMLLQVRVVLFIGSFMAVFLIGLVLEVLGLHRMQQAERDGPPA